MLNEQEKSALLHFLSVLTDNKIKSLANSITQGRITSKSREEGISILLLHGESLFSIMTNKKVTAACLLSYLHHLKAPSPGNATKETLLQHIYSIWKFPYPIIQQNNAVAMSMNNNNLSVPQASPQPQAYTPVGMNTPMNTFPLAATNSPNMQPFGYTSPSQNTMNQFNPQMQTAHMLPPNYPQPSNSLQLYDNTPKNPTSPYSQHIASYQLLKEVNSLAFDDFMVNFAKMFYELLNNVAGEFLHGLNRSHFFEECKMMIMIKGQDEDIEQTGETVLEVLKLLSDLKREHQLTFNPNLTPEGVRGKTDSHGLICAVASGTLHQGRGQLVGVFEQSFILRKDPFEQNSCKIADTTLILRSSNSVNSFSQLILPASKNRAIESAPSDHRPSHLQITNF